MILSESSTRQQCSCRTATEKHLVVLRVRKSEEKKENKGRRTTASFYLREAGKVVVTASSLASHVNVVCTTTGSHGAAACHLVDASPRLRL